MSSQDKAGQFTTRNGLVFDPDGVLLPIGNVVELLNATLSSDGSINAAPQEGASLTAGPAQHGEPAAAAPKRLAAWVGGVCKTCGSYTHSCKCEQTESGFLDLLKTQAEAPCETCHDDPAVCATIPGLRHCEAATRSASAFSDFIRNASDEEKEKVYREVMEKASARQAVSATAQGVACKFTSGRCHRARCNSVLACEASEAQSSGGSSKPLPLDYYADPRADE